MYEYTTVECNWKDLQQVLDEHAAARWKVIMVTEPSIRVFHIVMERQKEAA